MFNIKKQLSKLYSSSVLGNLSLTGAWVAILSARGYSLVEIGIAETVFHITSLIFEIPSGVLADVFGRKKMLMVSSIMRMIGNIIMILSCDLFMVCLSIAFHALSYNFSSGSGDALAYDSLKLAGMDNRFEKYESNQLIIYRLCNLNNRLLRNTEFLHQLCRLQIQLEPFQEFCRFLIHILFIQKQALYSFLTIQKNIFCNLQVWYDRSNRKQR